MRNLLKKTFALQILLISSSTWGASMVGRLGIGMTNHLVTSQKAISLKLQRNRSTAFGGHFAMDSSSDGMGYAMGLKGYKYIYEEPQLNFYSALSGTYFTYLNEEDDTESGYQVDGVFGTEFSFQGIESVGFSFEFGMSMYQYQEKTHVSTIGHNILAAAVHFYL